MNDPHEPPASPDAPPRALIVPRRRGRWSLVWIVPVLAALIGAWLGVRALHDQGPTIEIRFKTAEGLEPGKTRIRYKNLEIGTIETIRLAHDRKSVVAKAAMTRDATDLLVEDTRFWIVRPRIAGGQISGLTTVLSGSYVAIDAGKSAHERREFVALDVQPAITTDDPGREFVLRAADLGSLEIGSPVFHRRFQVGEVTAVGLDDDGRGVTARVFVHAPYEKYVTANTRFWQASGIDVSIEGTGVKVSTQSLLSVVLGGVAFEGPDGEAPGAPAAADTPFRLFTDRKAAMKRGDGDLEKFIAYFTDSIRGLAVGAPVEFRGYVVGEVRAIDMEVDRKNRQIRFPVEFGLYRDVLPERVARAAGSAAATDEEWRYRRAVEDRGFRAQLRTGNLLTGQKFLAIDFFKDAPKETLADVKDAQGNRILPTMPGTLDDLQETVTRIAKRIDRIPFDQLAAETTATLRQMRTSLAGVDAVMARVHDDVAPEVVRTLEDVRRTMRSADELVASDSPTQQDLRSTLVELQRAAASLRLLTDYLQRRPESLLRGKPPDPTGVAP